MAAVTAEKIFDDFQKLREGTMDSPQQRLETYCGNVLSSVETVYFDYKTKRDRRTPTLEEDDKKNLAKALSGFANTGGGVLLWGNKGGRSLRFEPIAEVQTFLHSLMELGPLATAPGVQGLNGAWIPSQADPTAGFSYSCR